MELLKLEDVNQEVQREIEREARRVAFAIDADEFHLVSYESLRDPSTDYYARVAEYSGLWEGVKIGWWIIGEGITLTSIRVGHGGQPPANVCVVCRDSKMTSEGILWSPWRTMGAGMCQPEARFKEHMARTLYRLGIDIDEEEYLAALNVSLTTHEKMELRLTMPREFWPKQWLTESEIKSAHGE